MKRLVFISSILFFQSIALAHQPDRGNIYVSLGPSILAVDTDTEYWGKEDELAYGLSLIVNGDVDRNGGLEVGMAYFDQLFFRDYNGQKLVQKAQRLHMNIGYRHWFVPNFSAGLLIMTSYSMGGEGNEASSDGVDFQTSAAEASDNGLSFSFQFEIPGKGDYAYLVDYRFTQMFHLPDGEDSRSHLITVGLKKHVQKK